MGSLCPFSLAPGARPLPSPARPPPSIWLPSGSVAAGALFIYLSQCNGVRRELASGWHSEAVPLGHRRFSWACESLELHAAPTSCGQARGQWQPPEGPALGSWQPLARTQPSAPETDWEFRVCACVRVHIHTRAVCEIGFLWEGALERHYQFFPHLFSEEQIQSPSGALCHLVFWVFHGCSGSYFEPFLCGDDGVGIV